MLCLLMALYPALQIQTDFNLEGFYPENDQVLDDYSVLENEFGRDDNTILIGFSHPDLLTNKVLNDIRQISDLLESVPHVSQIFSLWNAQQILLEDNKLTFQPYLNTDSQSDYNTLDLKNALTVDPFLNGVVINKEANTTSIIVQIDERKNSFSNRNDVIDGIQDILAGYEQSYTFHLSGIPYYRNQYVNMLNSEIIGYIAISSLLIIALLWFLYRTVWGILFPMMIVWATLLFTIAIIHITGSYLEIMSSTIAPILLCVGVADAIHMISKYDDEREQGFGKRPSIKEMMKTLGSATFLTSVTTAIGFASLFTSTVLPMKKFGIYTAVGVLIAYLVTIIFLPASLRLSKRKRIVDEKSGFFYPYISTLLAKLAALNRMHYKKVLIFSLFITSLFLLGILNLNVNGRVFDDISEKTKIMQDNRFFEDNLASYLPMEFIINTGEPDGVLSAPILKKAAELETILLEFPEIERVIGFHTIIQQTHGIFNDIPVPERTKLPDSDQTVAQYTLLLEVGGSDELYNLVDFDYSTLRVTAFTKDAGSKRINEIRDKVQNEISTLFNNQQVIVTGTTILSADLTGKIVYSLVWSIVLALLAITMIMVLLFKDIRLILIALIPNLIPLIITGGLMGFMGVDIKPSTAVIFTIALGISVDDSIHYLARFRIEYLKRGALFPALTHTTIRTGRAIITTSLILIAGFGTLITSSFVSTAMMGILVCTTIFTAVLSDLFVLPSLFYWLSPNLSESVKEET